MKILLMNLIKLFFLIIFISSSSYANNSYFSDGLSLFNNKEFDKAKFKFEQDIVYNPKNENSYLYLSKIFKAQKKKKLEEQNLDAVLLLNPKNEEAVYNLAKLKLDNSDYLQSKKLIDQLLGFCKNYCKQSKLLKNEINNYIKK